MVKINWGAALDVNKKIIGLGSIARDDKGTFLAALSKQLLIKVNLVVAATLAALHEVLFCKEQGYLTAIFEGDTLQVVKDVNLENLSNNMHGHIIEDIKAGIQTLNQVCFTHAKREANAITHELAVGARTHVIDTIRWTSIPSVVL
jgi:hypothetical protein